MKPRLVRPTATIGCAALAGLILTEIGCIPVPRFASFWLDRDGDGFADFVEITNDPPTDPDDPEDTPANPRDTDGDGCSDYGEVVFGHCDGDPNTPPKGTVTISGQLSVGANLVVDGDTADPANPEIENNAVEAGRAQWVPNPSTVGGYLGELLLGLDIRDVYRVQLAAGQVATLLVADPLVNDFDLFLHNENGDLLDSSEGVGRAEQVTAPSTGDFLVEVYGFSVEHENDAGGMYSLLIGESTLTSTIRMDPGDGLSSLHPFVADEVLVQFVEPDKSAARNRAAVDLGLDVLGGGASAGGWHRCRVSPNGKIAAQSRSTSAAATIAAVKALRRRPDVVHAQPNYLRRTMLTPNDEFYRSQWNYPLVGLPDAWDVTTGTPNVVVAVIDTGIARNHPDLRDQLLAGYDFVANPVTALDGDGIDPDPEDPGDAPAVGIDSSFHGSHVAGIVAGRTNNHIGIAGIAWNVRILPVRALGRGGAGADYDISQAIRYSAGLPNDSRTLPSRPSDVINLSLGGPGFSQVLADAVLAARSMGCILVAAAGNDAGNADNNYPGALQGVVSVAAVGFSRNRAPYSNTGSTVDVAAPGGNLRADENGDGIADGILSTIATDDGRFIYAFYDGTSLAVPHVSGIAALARSVNPDLTPEDFDLLLAGTHPATDLAITEDLGPPGRDDLYGHGLINALNTIRAAAAVAGDSAVAVPIIRVTPQDIFLSHEESSSTFAVANAGTGTLEVTNITSDRPWLAVAPARGGVGFYTLTLNRTGLGNGVYTARLTISSNGGSVVITVRMNVGPPQATGGDIGTVYVLLVDPVGLRTIRQDVVTFDDDYRFTFNGVEPGEYRLFAGTDLNNDFLVDQTGEAFGGYPIRSQTDIVDARENVSGLNFSATWQLNVQNPGTATASTGTGRGSAEPTWPAALRRIRQVEANGD